MKKVKEQKFERCEHTKFKDQCVLCRTTKNQVVEIHIYIHQVQVNPNGTGGNFPNPLIPPYYVTC